MKQFFEELKRRKVVRVGIAYLVAAWLLLQVTDVIVPILELPAWTARIVLYLLVAGFIVSLILAWVFELTIKRDRRKMELSENATSTGQKIEHGVVGLLAMALLGIAIFWFLGRDDRWVRDEAAPQIEAYVTAGNWEAAYRLGQVVERRVPGDLAMADLWGEFSWLTSIPSVPPGAKVFRRPYQDPDAAWELLGTTPIIDVRIPFGLSLVRFEIEHRSHVLRIIGGAAADRRNSTLPLQQKRPIDWYSRFRPEQFIIDTAESLPSGMVRVPGGRRIDDSDPFEIADFYIGRHEVTNREFKEFVDKDGYRRREFWRQEFVRDGRSLEWDEAMALFVDKSGRAGPSTWVGGSYPEGEENYPVSGVSWYEAAAYARFVERELPTYGHWRRAFADGALTWMLPASNLDNDRSAPVGQFNGVGWTGTFDMAGNVREWSHNAIGQQRVILGGSWSDLPYFVDDSVLDPQSMPPFDRSPINGFRLAQTAEDATVLASMRLPLPDPVSPPVAQPVSDEAFEIYRRAYDYDLEKPFNEEIEDIEESQYWTREHISIDATYQSDRIALHLYLPAQKASNYHTVMYWPSIGGFLFDTPQDIQRPPFEFILKNGRAVVYPELQGMFKRRGQGVPDWMSVAGRDIVYQEVIDFRRVIDYLSTRPEIDSKALGLFGISYGGRLGPMALAIEPRLRVGILHQAGINFEVGREIDVTHYLPRVTQPVLQFNGRYDTDFRYDTSAKPFFDLLGTPQADKKHVVGETGHFVSRPVLIGETLDWLDKYLGPVER